MNKALKNKKQKIKILHRICKFKKLQCDKSKMSTEYAHSSTMLIFKKYDKMIHKYKII